MRDDNRARLTALIGRVAQNTGVMLEHDDPILHTILLQDEAFAGYLAQLDEAFAEAEAAASAQARQERSQLNALVQALADKLREAMAPPTPPPDRPPPRQTALFVLGVLVLVNTAISVGLLVKLAQM